MVSMHSFAAAGRDTAAVLDELDRQILESNTTAHFVFAFFGCTHDGAKILDFLKSRFPGSAIVGGTSHSGFMSDGKLWEAVSIGIMTIEDADGQYGVSVSEIGEDAAATAESTLNAALKHASCPGELPALLFVYQAPGHEEEAIDGLRRVIGDRCPIVGGSSADEAQTGLWQQIGPEGAFKNGIAVAALFPSGSIGTTFQGGFEPAGPSGIVTRIGYDDGGQSGIVTKSRGREIVEIDGRPAAHVYNEWIGNALGVKSESGGNIFEETSMHPLGIVVGDIKGVPNFRLIHPKEVEADGTVNTFAAIEQGARIHFMRGNTQRLADRAGRVAAQAAAQLTGGVQSLAGGLMIYCTGCRMAVGEKMPQVARDVAESFLNRPLLTCFTYGEVGLISERNAHGNMMISAVAFGT